MLDFRNKRRRREGYPQEIEAEGGREVLIFILDSATRRDGGPGLLGGRRSMSSTSSITTRRTTVVYESIRAVARSVNPAPSQTPASWDHIIWPGMKIWFITSTNDSFSSPWYLSLCVFRQPPPQPTSSQLVQLLNSHGYSDFLVQWMSVSTRANCRLGDVKSRTLWMRFVGGVDLRVLDRWLQCLQRWHQGPATFTSPLVVPEVRWCPWCL